MGDSSKQLILGLRGNMPLPALKGYVDNRDDRLQMLSDMCKVSKVEAKDLYAQIISGGNYRNRKEIYSVTSTPSMSIFEFEGERRKWLQVLTRSVTSGPAANAIADALHTIQVDILTEAK